MNITVRDFPSGNLRASDADRDQALSELTEACRAGRLTLDEFEERSAQALRARTGQELAHLLADLPRHGLPGGGLPSTSTTVLSRWIAIGAAAITAVALAIVAMTNALNSGYEPEHRLVARAILAHLGLPVPLPARPGFDWIGTVVPGAVALLLVMVITFLLMIRVRGHRPCRRSTWKLACGGPERI